MLRRGSPVGAIGINRPGMWQMCGSTTIRDQSGSTAVNTFAQVSRTMSTSAEISH